MLIFRGVGGGLSLSPVVFVYMCTCHPAVEVRGNWVHHHVFCVCLGIYRILFSSKDCIALLIRIEVWKAEIWLDVLFSELVFAQCLAHYPLGGKTLILFRCGSIGPKSGLAPGCVPLCCYWSVLLVSVALSVVFDHFRHSPGTRAVKSQGVLNLSYECHQLQIFSIIVLFWTKSFDISKL